VFGSQSILGQHPEAPEALLLSVDVDVDPKNRPDRVDAIDGSLGEGNGGASLRERRPVGDQKRRTSSTYPYAPLGPSG